MSKEESTSLCLCVSLPADSESASVAMVTAEGLVAKGGCVLFHLLTLLPTHGQSQLELQLLLAAGLRSSLLQVRGTTRR